MLLYMLSYMLLYMLLYILLYRLLYIIYTVLFNDEKFCLYEVKNINVLNTLSRFE